MYIGRCEHGDTHTHTLTHTTAALNSISSFFGRLLAAIRAAVNARPENLSQPVGVLDGGRTREWALNSSEYAYMLRCHFTVYA